jgi:hypothetical protein
MKTFENNMQTHPLDFAFSKRSLQQEMKSFQDQMSILELGYIKLHNDEPVSVEDEKSLMKQIRSSLILRGLGEVSERQMRLELKTSITKTFASTIDMIRVKLLGKVEVLIEAYDFLPRDFGHKTNARDTSSSRESSIKFEEDNDDNPRKKSKKDKQKLKPRDEPKQLNSDKPKCYGCGWDKKKQQPTHPGGKASWICPRNDGKGCGSDPRRNPMNVPFIASTIGKRWVDAKYQALPKSLDITLANAKEKKLERNTIAGKYTCMINHCNNLLLENELIQFSLPFVQATLKRDILGNKPNVGSALTGSLLLDTGAIGSCVVSDVFFDKLVNLNISHTLHDTTHELNTAMNHNTISNKEISFSIYLKSEHLATTNEIEIPIRAIVAPIGVDLIIDKLTIKNNNLLTHYPSHFAKGELLDMLRQAPALHEQKEENNSSPVSKKRKRKKQASKSIEIPIDWVDERKKNFTALHHIWVQEQKDKKKKQEAIYKKDTKRAITYLATITSANRNKWDNNSDTSSFLAGMTSNFSTKHAFEREGNLTEIPDNKLESIPAELISDVHTENDYKKVTVEGTPLVKAEITKIVAEFGHVFQATVQGTPAKLKPFKLEVDLEKWQIPANQLRCRKLDRERETELGKMIKILIDANIIEACDAAYYSHAFLVPKPNGKWRMVLDFKNLNSATSNYYKWPLPDIKEMLNRVGDSRPEFFAVFDLTSGYYQAEVDEESREFTAFLTRHGVYRWLRLPMGLTGACSYFQKALVTQVLNELLHDGCELFLDDCMIHASSLDSFLKRLRQVFLRFSECGITLNPLKCKIGLTTVEYVGHTIDKNGLHFTRDKLDSVLNFPRPETKRQIKSFLGLANYFRDHIKNHSLRAQPLQEFVNKYDKSQARHKITWTPLANAAFEDLRQAIDECPMLWFMDDYSPIFLQTDASDYGIAAYLYQVITGEDGSVVEHPIGFISKSIASEHQSWDTPMKEGFAIFYSLKKWEYLLRDRQFTILTDHKNLTRLRADHDSNKMVKRWFMSYQEYDILDWQFVKGVDNGVPDKMSRLCNREDDVHPASLLFQLTGYEIPTEHWDTIAKYHNSGIKANTPGGHGGVERTLSQLDAAGLQWQHRTKHVRRFIRMCPCCQKMDQMKKIIHSYPFTVSTYGLWNTVSVDYIERLVTDKYGNNMIIVIVDNFSRFTELYPCNSTAAEGAADALISFCARYCCTPLHFTTDCGSNFKSNLIAGLLERLGSDHFLTTAYSKEMNALVERQNKEVLRHLKNIIFDHRVADKWSKYCPLVQRIINTSKNASTGLTPAEIVFPNGIQLDKTLMTESSSLFVSLYVSDMQQAQARIIALAEQSLRERDTQHMDNYSKERTVFDDGSFVLVEHRHNSLRRGPKSKLLPFLKGPLLVKHHNSEGIYVLQDLITEQVLDYHMSLLRPFLYDERTCTPLQAAVADSLDEFVVESVIRMRGDTRKSRKDLCFLVRWAGFGEADDTWEPWECCKDSHAVQKFLRAHSEARVRRLAKPVEAVVVPVSHDANESDISDDEC